MSSLLDIDLDYFAINPNPINELNKFLEWANNPVKFIVEKHHHILSKWDKLIKNGIISIPSHILHIDDHHDMMDEKKAPNIANFIYHAMIKWPKCRIHWVVEQPIDSPKMWLSEDTWKIVNRRFKIGRDIPNEWPKPDAVSVCTSPEFIDRKLRLDMLKHIELFNRQH